MFEFAWPWLWLLLPLPWLVRRLAPPARGQRDAALKVPFLAELEQIAASPGPALSGRHRGPLLLAYLAWVLLLAAAARPQWLGEPLPQQLQGRDLMLAVDLSASMQERDFVLGDRLINRLLATKVVAGDFIERRQGDRIGLILFGDRAYLQAPLTHDRTTVKQLLDEAQIGLAGEATAIGDAIGLAVKRLRELHSQQRILILMTDGSNTAGALAPEQATELAVAEGLRIYTIGIGRERSQQGLFGGFFAGRGAELDEAGLSRIAQRTGGSYFRAQDLDQLAGIYRQLDTLEPVMQDADFFRSMTALYHWPLLAALLLLSLLGGWQSRGARWI